MSIVVYYLDPTMIGPSAVGYEEFKDIELMESLKAAERLRKAGMRNVSISSELSDSVGKPGVDTITDDRKTPDGHDYEWSKQHRGAGPRT